MFAFYEKTCAIELTRGDKGTLSVEPSDGAEPTDTNALWLKVKE